jgi:hypothetical protein
MSKLARALALVAMLAALNLTGMTTIAQAHARDPASQRHRALGQLELPAAADHAVASREQTTRDDTLERRLAEEHHYSGTSREENPAIQQALAQERYYSTWGYGDTSAPAAAEPGGQPGWLTTALAVLAAVLALVAGVAVLAVRRGTRTRRASQTA